MKYWQENLHVLLITKFKRSSKKGETHSIFEKEARGKCLALNPPLALVASPII